LQRYDKFFSPAGLGPAEFHSGADDTLLECYPPAV